ncbi:MAG: serine aminopeptidase domain-containing protein [Rectinemataceae bacterium]
MRHPTSFLLAATSLLFVCALGAAQQQGAPSGASAASVSIGTGRWAGGLDFGRGREQLSLRILPEGGLLDLPGQRLFGYPLSGIRREGTRIVFALFAGKSGGQPSGASSPEASGNALIFSGDLKTGKDGGSRIEGSISRGGVVNGRFDLEPAPLAPEAGESSYLLDTGRGVLPGTLLLPPGNGPFPLVLILAGAGTADRDGNNYAVPGKNDALRLLAEALRDRGIASLRYDKRGAGESYYLVTKEEDLRFDDYVSDAVVALAALAALRADRRFSRLVVAGHTEGALVAAAALLAPGAPRVEGLALLCASGKSAVETVEAAVAAAPPALKAEGAAIMAALRAGRTYPHPSGYFADFFRPSFQPYLASWFRYDLKTELPADKAPVLLVQGNRDFQTTLADFDVLVRARPDAAAYVLPGMNHALKEVGPDLDENYRAFTDPSFPLAPQLADTLAAFAKGGTLPDRKYRYKPN